MFLKHKASGDLVEIMDVAALFDPCRAEVTGRFHSGEEMQDPDSFSKSGLVFPSDESLPRCWSDANYKG